METIGKKFNNDGVMTRERLKTIPLSELKREYTSDGGYFRRQKDDQRYIERSDEQKKVVDEYFIIRNVRTLSCEPSYRSTAFTMKVFSSITFILAIVLFIIGISEAGSYPVMAAVSLVTSGIFAIIKKSFMTKFDNSIKETEKPKKVMTDQEFDAAVQAKIESLNVPELALERLGLDESQIDEVKPVMIQNLALLDTSLVYCSEKDNRIRSSTQEASALYFSAEQVFAYKLRFDMCCNEKTEWTWEFFYDDICDITTKIDTKVVDVAGPDDDRHNRRSKHRKKMAEYSSTQVEIIATNSKMIFSIESNDEVLASIMAMKHKVRDRRNV